MDVRRLLTAVSAGVVGAAVTVVAIPTAAQAALPYPGGFKAARSADDVQKINVAWKAVPGADHFVVDTIAGAVQTVVNVPTSTLNYTVDAANNCDAYKVRVGTADATGTVISTNYWSFKSAAPGYVSGLAVNREDDGQVIAADWKTPSNPGLTPVTGYRVVLTRTADGVVLYDETSMDTSFRYPGADPARSYSLQVTPKNEYGACNTAKWTVDRFRPADPTDLVVERRADAPGTVEVVWKAGTSAGPAATYYQVGYGETKVTKYVKVDVPTTTAMLSLDPAKTWVVEVKAYNANGGSNPASGSVPTWAPAETPTVPAPTATSEPEPTTPAATPTPTPTASGGTGGTGTGSSGGSTADSGVETTHSTTTVSTGSDRTPPTIVPTLSATTKNGYFRSAVTIRFTCADAASSIASCTAPITVSKDGAGQRFSGTAVDAAGNTATVTLTLAVDQTPPSVSSTVKGDKNAAGWYKTPPMVQYTCSDTVSGVNTLAICPADTPLAIDGANHSVTGTATDKAGNTSTDTVIINLDQVAPVITATVQGDVNADGWYTTAPTIHYTCTDLTSGVAECPADRKVTEDGVGKEITGKAVDKAGNVASATVKLNVDVTAPTITASVAGEVNESGWYTTKPTVHFTCTDTGAGVTNCPADITLHEDGADQKVTGTATDKAGNTATAAILLSVDRVAPQITADVLGERNADGWFRTTPVIHFTCSDEGSAMATCPEDQEMVTDGGEQTVIGTATDMAGNTATARLTVNVDRTVPTITAEVLGEANADGWYRTSPVVHFTCTDEVSGIVNCPADTPVAADGLGKIVMGTVADKAGNTATTSVTVSLDQTAPVVTAALVEAPNANGWFNSAPTVRFTCTDEGSGLTVCPADVTVTKNGANQKITGTATDLAGNSTTAALTVNVDLIGPEVTATVEGTKNADGWYRTTPTVRYTCSDSDSAVASCPVDAKVTAEGVAVSVPGTASDKAGNTTTSTLNLNIDKTAPVVSVLGAVNGKVYGADSAPAVSCKTTDSGSGVATLAKLTQTSSNGAYTIICAGGVDKAGNTSAAVTIRYTVEATTNWLMALTKQYLGDNGTRDILGAFDLHLTKRQFLLYVAKVILMSMGRKPAFTSSESSTLIYYAFAMDCKR
ncbi:Neogenin [Actinoplanes sp. NPDC051859]|uniref:Neogenin n=1 Tax=Actinoplanes sp. NPDC051859 TaxID=3363909 RepID=UPI00378766C4